MTLGTSLVTRNPLTDDLKVRFPATAELTLCAMLVALLIGIPAGIISAVKQNTAIDTVEHVRVAGWGPPSPSTGWG